MKRFQSRQKQSSYRDVSIYLPEIEREAPHPDQEIESKHLDI